MSTRTPGFAEIAGQEDFERFAGFIRSVIEQREEREAIEAEAAEAELDRRVITWGTR